MKELTHNGRQIEIRYHCFPEALRGHLRGACMIRNNRYVILIDNKLPEEIQRRTLGHELAHVFLGHLDSRKMKVNVAEFEADMAEEEYMQRYAAGDLGD